MVLKRKIALIYILLSAMLFTGCTKGLFLRSPGGDGDAAGGHSTVLMLNREKLQEIPSYDKYSPNAMQVDLRSYDLTGLMLDDKKDDLLHADFDTKTIWPFRMPDGFDPKLIMKYGKSPGLNIDKLHQDGIAGKGVGIAIIGSPILAGHMEYKDNLKLYDDTGCTDKTATVDGCAIISVAAGKKTGVAPGATVYYITETRISSDDGEKAGAEFFSIYDDNKSQNIDQSSLRQSVGSGAGSSPLSQSIDKILEINRKLPAGSKIRVICISEDITSGIAGYSIIGKAVQKAKDSGIFVVSNLLYDAYDQTMYFNGLGRDPQKDPDKTLSYRPGASWENGFYTFERYSKTDEALLVPMDSRCAAAPTGTGDYAFYTGGSRSMCIGYIGGLYALMCQAKPDITPERFWKAALETGDLIMIKKNNIDYKLKKIVNPLKLYDRIIHG